MNDKKGRNSGIELFRILMMFGIVLLHVCGQGKYGCVWPANLLRGAVVCFVFISGYYGIRFTLSKFVGLYSLAVFYCCLEPIIGGVAPFGGGYQQAVLDAWRAKEGYWFLHAYAILMTIAPLLEEKFKACKDHGQVLASSVAFLLVIFVWSYSLCFPSLSRIVPQPNGLTSSSGFMTMLGIYIGARLFRFYELDKVIRTRVALVGFATTTVVISVTKNYLAVYASPFLFLLAMFCFCLFLKIHLADWASRVVAIIAPSMFGVYLLHAMLYLPGMENKVYTMINFTRDPLIAGGMNRYLAYIIVAIEVFFISLVIDGLRRIILFPAKRFIISWNSWVDTLLLRVSSAIIGKCNTQR